MSEKKIKRIVREKKMENTFRQDLALGEFWELEAVKKMSPDTYLKMEGKFSYFDYITVKDNVITLIEVKSDRWASKTGNIAIECISSGKASGIQLTQAHYWMYVVIDKEPEFYKIPVPILKDLIQRQEYSEIKAVAENGKNICYLFDKNTFSQYRMA